MHLVADARRTQHERLRRSRALCAAAAGSARSRVRPDVGAGRRGSRALASTVSPSRTWGRPAVARGTVTWRAPAVISQSRSMPSMKMVGEPRNPSPFGVLISATNRTRERPAIPHRSIMGTLPHAR